MHALIRDEFRNRGYELSPHVESALLTTGFASPNGKLRPFASCCLAAVLGVPVDVVGGRNERFE